MNSCDHTLALYEVRIKGFEDSLEGRMQLWHPVEEFSCVSWLGPMFRWPADYTLIGVLETDDLDEAYRWTQNDYHSDWARAEIHLFWPYGWTWDQEVNGPDLIIPRSTSVNDVLVKPDGTVHAVRSVGFECLGKL